MPRFKNRPLKATSQESLQDTTLDEEQIKQLEEQLLEIQRERETIRRRIEEKKKNYQGFSDNRRRASRLHRSDSDEDMRDESRFRESDEYNDSDDSISNRPSTSSFQNPKSETRKLAEGMDRASKRLEFNFEKIIQKYSERGDEDDPEKLVELDAHGNVYFPRSMTARQQQAYIDKMHRKDGKFGKSLISAPRNSVDVFDGDKKTFRKCSQIDEEFDDRVECSNYRREPEAKRMGRKSVPRYRRQSWRNVPRRTSDRFRHSNSNRDRERISNTPSDEDAYGEDEYETTDEEEEEDSGSSSSSVSSISSESEDASEDDIDLEQKVIPKPAELTPKVLAEVSLPTNQKTPKRVSSAKKEVRPTKSATKKENELNDVDEKLKDSIGTASSSTQIPMEVSSAKPKNLSTPKLQTSSPKEARLLRSASRKENELKSSPKDVVMTSQDPINKELVEKEMKPMLTTPSLSSKVKVKTPISSRKSAVKIMKAEEDPTEKTREIKNEVSEPRKEASDVIFVESKPSTSVRRSARRAPMKNLDSWIKKEPTPTPTVEKPPIEASEPSSGIKMNEGSNAETNPVSKMEGVVEAALLSKITSKKRRSSNTPNDGDTNKQKKRRVSKRLGSDQPSTSKAKCEKSDPDDAASTSTNSIIVNHNFELSDEELGKCAPKKKNDVEEEPKQKPLTFWNQLVTLLDIKHYEGINKSKPTFFGMPLAEVQSNIDEFSSLLEMWSDSASRAPLSRENDTFEREYRRYLAQHAKSRQDVRAGYDLTLISP